MGYQVSSVVQDCGFCKYKPNLLSDRAGHAFIYLGQLPVSKLRCNVLRVPMLMPDWVGPCAVRTSLSVLVPVSIPFLTKTETVLDNDDSDASRSQSY
jgi:hypothetical protein